MKNTHFANLFAQSINLATEFATDFTRTFQSNTFDKYARKDGKVYIKHSVDRDTKLDVFRNHSNFPSSGKNRNSCCVSSIPLLSHGK